MRRLLLAAICALLFAAPAMADDKPKPNTLSAKEVADGDVLLFDGETTFGWKVDGAAEVKDGKLIIGRGKKTVAYPTTGFGDRYQLSLAVTGKARIHLQPGIIAVDTSSPELKNVPYHIWIKQLGKEFEYTGDKTIGKPEDTTNSRPELTRTPFVVETDGTSEVAVIGAKLRPLDAKPLFTGKDLDGWKVNAADPKRMSSKFEVTTDGELSVKNGPGDLATEKEFANFVLQFECKTLGEGLNSGIFFRCIPGQYQNGYEAQIQNAFLDNDRTKPKDFGTGAIYRRIAARKVVSNDNEWFTMTVVADGKHIATWVNGYQTVDWTDDRKENDNPRQGFRAAKGPLSIQGHDPTTNLLFRNIRIAELPGK